MHLLPTLEYNCQFKYHINFCFVVDGAVECQFYIQPGDNDITVEVRTVLYDIYIEYNVSYDNGSSHEIKFAGTLLQRLKTEQFCAQMVYCFILCF